MTSDTQTVGSISTAGWSVADHLDARRRGVSAEQVMDQILAHLESIDDPAILIGDPLRHAAMTAARELDTRDPADYPLHGVPFLVKDNIDVQGVETTCGCPSFAYVAAADAEVVARLRRAGAIPVGKTNLDQFATGLVGTRSPYGIARNPLNPSLVPGGSSSGSAVAVARGLVPFALGTDTAGSGRVPAAMCGIVGLKPTVGRFPSRGVVPAVRRIDCPTIFSTTVADARYVARIMAGHDSFDPFSKSPVAAKSAIGTIGVPTNLGALVEFMDDDALRAYESAVAEIATRWNVVEIDIGPYLEAGRLLYGGPFVAERTAAVGGFLSKEPADLDPTVAAIIRGGSVYGAVEAYENEYRVLDLKREVAADWTVVDAIALPTIPGTATLAEVEAEPVAANVRLGTFTTFVNLLDLAAIAIPVGTRADGLPSGLQLIGPAWTDEALADAAQTLLGEPIPVEGPRVGEQLIAVVGAHLQGMPLNHQLTSRGARLVSVTATAPAYQLFALPGTVPPKPGLRRVSDGGHSIIVEVWAMSVADFGSFTAEVPPPLGIGSVELADGTLCNGFICEPGGFTDATDISHYGGWRAYRAAQSAPSTTPSSTVAASGAS